MTTELEKWIEEMEAMCGTLPKGPWHYGGMIGDPGKPLRHFIENADGIVCVSEPFAVDYADGSGKFRAIALARTALPTALKMIRAMLAAHGSCADDAAYEAAEEVLEAQA